MLHPPVYGAYTHLFAGLSPGVGVEKSGEWGECFPCLPGTLGNNLLICDQLFLGGALGTSVRIW